MADCDVHVHHHFHNADMHGIRLDQLFSLVQELREELMAVSQEIKDAMARIDAATNAIAERLNALAEQIKTGMSAADVSEVVSGLQAEATKLEGIGQNPENPVPPTTA